jgi:hypothetical protein
MNLYLLVIQMQVIWIQMVGVVKCEISSYRAGFVDWDFVIGKHSARTIMGQLHLYILLRLIASFAETPSFLLYAV